MLRRGSPTPACKRCRRFFDDVRGHAIGCKLGPTGVAQVEHGFRQAAQQETYTKCPEAWVRGPADAPTLIDEINTEEVWTVHTVTGIAVQPQAYRYKNTDYVVWRWLGETSWRAGTVINDKSGDCNSELGDKFTDASVAKAFVELHVNGNNKTKT